MHVTVDYALTQIGINAISPWTSPFEWINAASNYLLAIVRRISMLVESDEIEKVGLGVGPQAMIYPVHSGLAIVQLKTMELTMLYDHLVKASHCLYICPSGTLHKEQKVLSCLSFMPIPF
jgi:hypothetical protein